MAKALTSKAPLWNGRRMGTVCSYAAHKKAGQEIRALGFQVKESNDFKPLDRNAHSAYTHGGWHYAYTGTGAFDINWLHEGANSWIETMLIDLYVVPILRKHGVRGIIHKPRNRNDHKTWCHADRGSYHDYTVRRWSASQRKRAASLIAKHRTSGGGSTSKPKSSGSKTTVLRLGSKGARVGTLQRGLNKAFPAYSRLTVDNSYGHATQKVVKEFQRRAGLKQDGIAGPATQSKLRAYGVRI